ncbi:hypothetical protein [Microbaculum marinum]|uniref:Uncharacterized protein n=1 Tax=Microbaculum marinum TaxID=1764581 RepID=A0AAW9RHK0_9HYPH
MIADIAALVVVCAIAVECIVRLPFIALVRAVVDASGKALRVVRSRRISDHWKEKVMLAYSGETLAATLKLLVLLVLVGAALVAVSLGVDRITGNFLEFIASPLGIAGSLVAAGAYAKARTLVAPRIARL